MVALSKTSCLLSLNTNQTVRGEIKIDAVCPTLKFTRRRARAHTHDPKALSNALVSISTSNQIMQKPDT